MVVDHQNIKTDQKLGLENLLKYPIWIRKILSHEIFVLKMQKLTKNLMSRTYQSLYLKIG